MGNAQPISDAKLKELRRKYDKDDNGLSWNEFRELAVEVGELQGLKTPVSEEKLKKIFEGLDADKSGVVSIQEFEAAYAMLEKQLQAAAKAKAKAKAKGKAKSEGKAKPKPKPKAAAPAPAEVEGSIFDALPGFGSFVPDLSLPELPSVLEDTRVPQARPIPTPKKTKPPPLPEPSPPALSTQVPWSTQLKAADPDWYDEDDAGYSSNSSLDAGELPDAPDADGAAPADAAAPAPKAPPKPAAPKPKAKGRAGSPKAKAKVNVAKPKVQPKGRAQGISAMDGVTDDAFSSPIHRREAVAHPTDRADPQAVRVLQTAGGMDMVQQDPEVLSEPESQDSVDSISGEIARSWDPSAKDVRYSYARDRAVGFSEFWRPLKWSEAEWERRLQASGNLKRTVARAKLNEPKAKPKAAPVQETAADEPEDLIAPEKPRPRSQYPLATEVKPKYIDVPLKGLQGVATESAVGALRKTQRQPVVPVLEQSLDDELLGALPPTVPPRQGVPLVPLSSVAPAHLRERPAQPPSPQTPPESPIDAPRFGYRSNWQAPQPLYSGPSRTLLRPMMQEVQPNAEEQPATGEYGDRAGRTWL